MIMKRTTLTDCKKIHSNPVSNVYLQINTVFACPAQNKLIDTMHEDDAARGVWNKSQDVEVRKMVRFSFSLKLHALYLMLRLKLHFILTYINYY